VNDILGPPLAAWATVRRNLEQMGAHPLGLDDVAPLLYRIAEEHGVNPDGVVAQSFKETGGWHYAGNVRHWFHNTAGIKVRYDRDVMSLLGTDDANHPLVHAMFPNWRVGCLAHVQRLLDYCDALPDPEDPEDPLLIVDPRHGFGNRGITTWDQLGGRWAGDPNYGRSILDIRSRLLA
jgi:hypothetical protein